MRRLPIDPVRSKNAFDTIRWAALISLDENGGAAVFHSVSHYGSQLRRKI